MMEPPEQLTYYTRRCGASGICGQLYEIHLLMHLLLEGIRRNDDGLLESFHLATNMEVAGCFDDVVMKTKYKNNKTDIIFLQAKHKESDKKCKVTMSMLLSETEKNFMLKKYFATFLKMRKLFEEAGHQTSDPVFSERFENCRFIIFTNARLDTFNSAFEAEEIEREDVLFLGAGLMKHKIMLRSLFNNNKKLVTVLKSVSECKTLANELAGSMFSTAGIDVDNGIVKEYHATLAKYVIEKRAIGVGRFRKTFLTGDLVFRNTLLNKINKLREFNSLSRRELIVVLESREIKLPKHFGKFKDDCVKKLIESKEIKLPKHFGKFKDDCVKKLPSDLVTAEDIHSFLSNLRIYSGQPNETELGAIIKRNILKTYALEDVNSCFSELKQVVEKWWKEGAHYMTEKNKMHKILRVSIELDVKKPVPLFSGRSDELRRLHRMVFRQLPNEPITVVSGMGGVGKTELVRRYIEIYRKCYFDNIIWVKAESEDTMVKSFRELATKKLRIPIRDDEGKEKNIETIVEEVYKFFKKRKSLFVFDNAVNDGNINVFLPLRSSDEYKPHIILTSCDQEWRISRENIHLDILNERDAMEFVKNGLDDEIANYSEVVALIETLQYFPLAIQQAISYINDQRVIRDYGIKTYIREYQTNKMLLDSEEFKDFHNDYAKTTFTTWGLAIDLISGDKKYGKLAVDIMEIIAYLASDQIDRDIFLSIAGNDVEILRCTIRLLAKYSIVKGSDKQQTLSVHRLVQEVTRMNVKSLGRECQVLVKSLKLIEEHFSLSIIDHAVLLCEHCAEHCRRALEEFISIPVRIIAILNSAARYEEAVIFGRKIFEPNDSYVDGERFEYLTLRYNLSISILGLGKYSDALRLLQITLNQYKACEEATPVDILRIKHSIADVFEHLGMYAESLDAYNEVLSGRTDFLGPNHPDTLETHHKIGHVLKCQNKFVKAFNELNHVWSKRKRILGIDHVETLTTENELAWVAYRLGTCWRSFYLFEDVLSKRSALLGPNHPDTLVSKLGLALVFQGLARNDECLATLNEILEQYGAYGPDHTYSLVVQQYKAGLLIQMGKRKEAKEILNKVLDERVRIFGPKHPETLATKRYIEAWDHHQKGKDKCRVM